MAAQYSFVMKGLTKTFPGAPKPILISHDGKRQRVVTTDATVADVLHHLKITVGRRDRLVPPRSTPIPGGPGSPTDTSWWPAPASTT